MLQSKEKRIDSFLTSAFSVAPSPAPIRGDASLRSFYRIPFRGRSAILMIREKHEPEEDRIFLEMQSHLAACGAAVPEIYGYDPKNGVILMEDCGDLTLQEKLRQSDDKELNRFYPLAIEEMLKIQIRGSVIPRSSIAFSRAFDEKKLMEELNFFLRHTVEGYFLAKLGKSERNEILNAFAALSRELAALPRVLNHRDYHSRNLMIMDDSIRIVDFQDARMGPCQYDLASLLRDSYTILEDSFRRDAIGYYLRRSEEVGMRWTDAGEFMRRFDLVSLQRNIKACGTFGYMAKVRGDDRYLQYFSPTFGYVRENAGKFDYMRRCVKILARHIPPLG